MTVDAMRKLIDPDHLEISIARQCELLGLARSSWYYQAASETEENLSLLRLIDEEYTRHPFYGSRRMVVMMEREGCDVNRKRVQRLMGVLGIEAIYPKPRLTQDDKKGSSGKRILFREPGNPRAKAISFL